MKRIVVFLLFFLNFCSVLSSMDRIRRWSDVKKFAGRAVAYKTNSYYIFGEKNYKLGSQGEVKYAVIDRKPLSWEPVGFGYNLIRITNRESIPSTHALTDKIIDQAGYLLMRLLTEQEKVLLKKAITLGSAKIEYVFDINEAILLIR